MRLSRGFSWLAAAVLGAGLLLSAPAVDADSAAGKTLVDQVCTQCHGLPPIASVRNGAEGWRVVVYKMVQNGAQVRSEAELDTVVSYLAEAYGPAAGPLVTGTLPADAVIGAGTSSASIELPPGKGADLVKAECTLCHDLGRIVATRRTAQAWQNYTRVMLARGSLAPGRAATQQIAAYLTAHFGAPGAD